MKGEKEGECYKKDGKQQRKQRKGEEREYSKTRKGDGEKRDMGES